MPAHLEFRDTLPKTAVGKLSKKELIEEERQKLKPLPQMKAVIPASGVSPRAGTQHHGFAEPWVPDISLREIPG